jgi:hypothetical protein
MTIASRTTQSHSLAEIASLTWPYAAPSRGDYLLQLDPASLCRRALNGVANGMHGKTLMEIGVRPRRRFGVDDLARGVEADHMDRAGEDDSLDGMAESRIEYVFRLDDIGLQNPLGTVRHPDGAEMDDGARAGDKAVNLGSVEEIGQSDFFAGKRRREFPDIGTAQTCRPRRKMRMKPANEFPGGTGEKDSVLAYPWQALPYPCFRRST